MRAADVTGSCVRSTAQSARSAASGNATSVEMTYRRAAGSVIQRGMWRSMPSGPRTVMGTCGRDEWCTTCSSIPVSG